MQREKNTKKIWAILGLILVYVANYLICSFIFVALFHTSLLSEMKVLMYKGIVFILITGVLAAILMIIEGKCFKNLGINIKDVILMFCGFCCVNMVLFTMIPVTVERSVSVFMLSYMEENDNKAFTEDEIRDVFIEKYVDEFGAFDKRFQEQIVSGNLVYNEEKNGYELTDAGAAVVKMFRIVAEWFNTDERLVYPCKN